MNTLLIIFVPFLCFVGWLIFEAMHPHEMTDEEIELDERLRNER